MCGIKMCNDLIKLIHVQPSPNKLCVAPKQTDKETKGYKRRQTYRRTGRYPEKTYGLTYAKTKKKTKKSKKTN